VIAEGAGAREDDVARTAELVEVLGRAGTLPELLQPALAGFCRATGWRVAQAWVPDEAGERLVAAPAWYADDPRFDSVRDLSRGLRFARGEGVPGEVWRANRACWLDALPSPDHPRTELLHRLGLRAALGVPVGDGSRLVAVLEFLTDRPRSQDARDLGLVSILAAHLAALVTSRRNEARLSESESRFRAVADTAGDGIVCIDAAGVITYVNRRAEAMFGRPGAELLGRPGRVLVPERLRAAHDAAIVRLAAGEEPNLLGETAELIGVRRDGTEFAAEVTLAPLDGAAGIEGYTAVLRDLTERRREHLALRRTTRQLVDAQRLAGLGSWEWNTESNTLRWSTEMRRIFCLEPTSGALTYQDFIDRVHPDDRDLVNDTVQRAYETGSPFGFIHRIIRDDGHVRTLQGRGEVVLEDGRRVGMIGTGMDITDRLDAERDRVDLERRLQEAERLDSIGRLAGGVAHDFNNLLTVIRSYASHLRGQVDDGSELAEAVDEIRRAADDGADLTRQLLTFSRRDPGSPRALDLNEVIRSRAGLLERTLGEHLTLELDLDEGACVAELDRGQLEQILMNLTLNARDALTAGGTVRVATGRRDGRISLSVADTGAGMAPDVLARAFEPFFTTKPRGKGTGLGLASVHGIVKRAGGDIELSSRAGEGTMVEIELRAADGVPERPAAPAEPADVVAHGTVLVVEDQAAIRTLARRCLVRAGYRVHEAADGEEALARVVSDAPDLLLTDVVMPHMSGVTLAQRLRARFPEMRVLFVSGHPDELLLEQGVSAPELLLLKPFSTEELLDAVGRALRGEPAAAAWRS
jgi:hypothetical protein